MNQEYKNQVKLLLNVLPAVANEKCFALHGGTAINLFVRNMPRLSVDIDLTYIQLEDRLTSIENIALALTRIKENLERKIPGLSAILKKNIGKLLITTKDASVKLEVNLVGRGVIQEPVILTLCEKAQKEYEVFCEIQVVPLGQLYGGKICAALDRQHPRDLFDIKYLLENEGITKDIKAGFLYCLLGSERPILEILNPHFLDQKQALKNQFDGMTLDPFTYEEYDQTRKKLIGAILNSLTQSDKEFLIQFKNTSPVWNTYNYADFPSVLWKLMNLEKLKKSNPKKHSQFFQALKAFLEN